MASVHSSLHFVMIPLMAQGHMIPMFDIAHKLAERGIITTIYTTPLNASRFRGTMSRARESGHSIRLVEVPFRWKEVGLPEGCENLDTLPSPDYLKRFHRAVEMMQTPVEDHMRQHDPPPSCVLSDRALFWTSETARKFRVPRFLFNGMSCFSRLAVYNVEKHYKSCPDHYLNLPDQELFEVRGMPQSIKMSKSRMPATFGQVPNLADVRAKVHEAEKATDGIIMNSFDELEQSCVPLYEKAINQKIWCIGPVSLCNKNEGDRLHRGNQPPDEAKQCIEWLKTKRPRTVIYACLGSLCRLVPDQLIELGKGLEASNRPFVWVMKTGGSERALVLERWLKDERFEERIQGRGFLIRGWAPQLEILSHRSIGAFVTHCGWNSTLEGVCSGIPMITWPQFAEQFLNEAMVVDLLRIGVRVGVEKAVKFGEEEKVGVLVKKGDVLKAIEEVMSSGEEGKERRKRAAELCEKGKKAVQEGGSSYLNLSNLIQYVVQDLHRLEDNGPEETEVQRNKDYLEHTAPPDDEGVTGTLVIGTTCPDYTVSST